MQVSRFFLLSLGAVALVSTVACTPSGTKFGPIPVDVALQGGTIDPAPFVLLQGDDTVTITTRQDFCNMPTEQDVVSQMPSIGGFSLAGFAHLTELKVAGATLTATQGDFGFLREIIVSYVPKPSLGLPEQSIEIGRASSATGFGASIDLTPTGDVDFLQLIRDNDDNSTPGCPQIEITVTGAHLEQPVDWTGQARVEIFGLLKP